MSEAGPTSRRAATPVRLIIVRHGEAAANLEMRYLGSRDDPLTEKGIWQAGRLAAALTVMPIAQVYSSPLKRAANTAAPIAQARKVPLTVDERLREASFGDWEGLTRAEVLARGPEDAELLQRWESDPLCAPPNGESLRSVHDRALAMVAEIASRHAGTAVALVSHVSPIKALLAAALGIELVATRRFFLDPATITVVDWGVRPVLRLFNSHQHLGWESARWMNLGSKM